MNTKENISYLKYFGFKLTFSKTLNTLFKISKGELAWKIHDINNNVIEEYLKEVCSRSYDRLKNGYYDDFKLHIIDDVMFCNENIKKNNTIWTIWWQGEDNAPRIVKECIRSMRRYSNGHPVIVLDKDNYKEYMKLPEVIEKRFKEGIYDNTNLCKCTLDITKESDIMRAYLLYCYGGLWCDATMMFTGDVNEEMFTNTWSTLGQDDSWYIGRGKWSSFFMGASKGNGLIKFNYDAHIEYWTNEKYFVHYLMTDHLFDIAYKERIIFSRMIDNVQTGNKKCLTINRLYEAECNKDEADAFFETQHFHKLSWRWWGNDAEAECELYSENGKLTWLGYLFEKYIEV